MREIKKGNVVSRNSYKNDIMFYVKKIMKLTDGRKIAILKGIDVRVEADAPVEDLQIVSKEEQMRREKESGKPEKLYRKIRRINKRNRTGKRQ